MELHGELLNSVNDCEINFFTELKWTRPRINWENVNHETDYIKISQNQHAAKVVDVTVVTHKQVSPASKDAQKESEKETQPVDTCKLTFSAKHRKMKTHSEKLVNVSDIQVPDEQDRFAARTIKTNRQNVKERM